jgi:hypothetical protein
VKDKDKLSITFAERGATISGGSGATIEQKGASVSVALKGYATEAECAAHPIVLSGTTSDGELDLITDGMVCIQLDGLTLSNPSDPVIDIQANGAKVFIDVLAGTTNKLTSGTSGGTDGNNVIESDGSLVFDGSGSLDLVSYAKHGVSTNEDVVIKGGAIASTVSAKGRSNFKVDGSFSMSGGTLDLTNNASVLYEPSGVNGPDTTSGAGIKVDGDVSLTGGSIKIVATGTGGKGISADGAVTFDGTDVTIHTSGEAEYDSHAKGVKAEGNVEIYKGDITVTTTGKPTQDGGPEGSESKMDMTIHGGNIVLNTTDDALNAKTSLTINGGQIFAAASENDAIDSNGDLTINGGLLLAYGATGAETGIDAAEGYTVYIKGGTVVSMGGNQGGGGGGFGGRPGQTTSGNTYDIPSFSLTPSSFGVVKVSDASGKTVALFEIPSGKYGSTSGTGRPGGMGGSSASLLFASDSMAAGAYTVEYYASGAASGTEWEGWYTDGSVSGTASATASATAK